MIEIRVKKSEENLLILWQLSKVIIPLVEIVEVTRDETYGGENSSAIRIGIPAGSTDRIVIQTTKDQYILFTSNADVLEKKIKSMMSR